jgi:hypothetical protein
MSLHQRASFSLVRMLTDEAELVCRKGGAVSDHADHTDQPVITASQLAQV